MCLPCVCLLAEKQEIKEGRTGLKGKGLENVQKIWNFVQRKQT